MQKSKLTIIGAGNMASSLLGGLIAQQFDPAQICITDINYKKLQSLQQQYGVQIQQNNLQAIKNAEVVLLAVKPQHLKQAAVNLLSVLQEQTSLVISIAAGIQLSVLQHWLGEKTAIVRSMPNTPAMAGCGATGLFANANVTALQKKRAESIMQAVGITHWCDEESQLDAITAVSGSGPAYFFLFMEALEQAALESGLTSEVAHQFTLQTVLGAAILAQQSQAAFAVLREQVTSPGGTTAAALEIFNENQFNTIVKKAVFAAKNRAQQLAKEQL